RLGSCHRKAHRRRTWRHDHVRQHARCGNDVHHHAAHACDAAHIRAAIGDGWRRVSRYRRLTGALLLALPSACVTVHRPRFALPEPTRDWPTAIEAAQRQAIAGKFGAADSTLAEFAQDYPGSPEALETAYWRALFALDPTNQHASVTTAMASLDAYL